MIKCKDIIKIVNELAPENLAESWDNSGFIIGEYEKNIENILISLDFTLDTLKEAVDRNCQMVITHHPPIFTKLCKITDVTPLGNLLVETIKAGVCVYSSHTNLDLAGGTNDCLFRKLELEQKGFFMPEIDGNSLGRTGVLKKEMTLESFCAFAKEKLQLECIQFIGDKDSIVKKVALFTGSGAYAEYFTRASELGADVYLTADLKYHDALDALAMGLNVVDGTHFATEFPVCEFLKDYLSDKLSEKNIGVFISTTAKQPFKYVL